jgi:hypothetical protein
MKQIYYTQCPIGYGLGASNGFQIKRLSPGYPISSDFRYLGMRAFVAGTRNLAPPALRYRRGQDGLAEVAWLTPRSHEYDTERGLWGRPGGHFAHGILLDEAELSTIGDWPAGLYDRPFWTRTDREPSRGAPPAPLELSASDLRFPPTFENVAPLAATDDLERLARLLTATATAVREGRTLFLLDAPERLADRIAVLTFAFPPPWRASITFSTYHDRPEELPGYRIQGTLSAARPNRLALLSQGIIADIERGTFEPSIEPTPWSLTLAGWLIAGGTAESKAWTEMRALLQRGAGKTPEGIWAADWMENLFATHAMLRGAGTPPSSPADWQSLGELTRWAHAARLAKPAAKVRGPEWWKQHATDLPEARDALLEALALPDSWSDQRHEAAWGHTFGLWIGHCGPLEQRRLVQMTLTAIPVNGRAGFLRAMLAEWPIESVDGILRWLKTLPELEPALLLPSEVRGAVDAALARGETADLAEVLTRALQAPHALVATLEALEIQAGARQGAREALAPLLADSLEHALPAALAEAQSWALRQTHETAATWLAPYLRRLFANPLARDEWSAIRDRTPSELQPSLARIAATVASSPELKEAFPWCVEQLVLRLPDSDRPSDPDWPGLYLDRSHSDIGLLDRLYEKTDRPRVILDWLKSANRRGELTPEQLARLKNINSIQRAIRSGDPLGLAQVDLAALPPRDRGPFLERFLSRLDSASVDSVNQLLSWCRDAWPGGFAPGEPELPEVADVLADSPALIAARQSPVTWWRALRAILEQLGLEGPGGAGFEPNGLAANLVGATSLRLANESAAWEFRRFVLQQEPGWKTLARAVRRELAGKNADAALSVFRLWDDTLDKGPWTGRFYETFLNAANDSLLEAIVLDRAADLRGLELTWWSASGVPGAVADLRDRFVRTASLAPIDENTLPVVEKWLFPVKRQAVVVEQDELMPLDSDEPTRSASGVRDAAALSAAGLNRWRCLEALSQFVNAAGILSSARWATIIDPRDGPRLDQLDEDERYQFIAWLIMMTDDLELELELVPIPALAEWLWKRKIRDAARIETRWADELAEVARVPHELKRNRGRFTTALCDRLARIDFHAREAGRKPGPSGSP